MKYYYDLHIHTALSPCADNDMTPNNIVHMALLKGLDFIAITDHNTAGNVDAVMQCASSKDIIVIPGMEVESAEEVHILCLFPTLKDAKSMEELIAKNLPPIKNRADIFGEQILYDKGDNVIGYHENLLVTATSLTINDIKDSAENFGGVAIPAHIDRSSYSIISNLGFISEDLNFSTVEISKRNNNILNYYLQLNHYKIICNSDAHDLGQISEAENSIELEEKTISCLFHYLKQK